MISQCPVYKNVQNPFGLLVYVYMGGERYIKQLGEYLANYHLINNQNMARLSSLLLKKMLKLNSNASALNA